jgi:hypothetical protein
MASADGVGGGSAGDGSGGGSDCSVSGTWDMAGPNATVGTPPAIRQGGG